MSRPKESPAPDFDTLWRSLNLSESGKKASPGTTFKPKRPLQEATLPTAATLPMAKAPSSPMRPTLASLPVLSFEEAQGGAEAGDLARLGLLGEGGMGRVELAMQRSLRREVAVKSLKASQKSPAVIDALLHEALITGALEHPNIIPVHALGRDEEGRPLLVMKRIEGVSWKKVLHDSPAEEGERGSLSEHDLVRHLEILKQVSNAVHFAHSRGVLHRDIKPENVMVGDFGEVSLVDWGVALRMDEEQEHQGLTGTPAYMAPEMLSGGVRLSPKTDVYLLGAALHEVLTGHPPHTGENIQAVLFSVFSSTPRAYGPEVPEELAEICHKAMHPSPEQRFSSAAAFRQALVDFLRHRGSVKLGKEASSRLSELRRLLLAKASLGEEPQPSSPEDALSLRKLFAECRFGFQQAIREWEGNALARRGLTDCLELMAGYEIRQRNKGVAEALLVEHPSPPPALLSALEALREELKKDAEAKERLRALEHEQDIRVSMRQRTRFMKLLALLNLVIIAWFAIKVHRGDPLTHAMLLWTMAPLEAFFLLFIFLDREALLKTTVSRRIIASVLVGMSAMLANRALAMILHPPIAQVFVIDLLLLGVTTMIGGIALFRMALYLSPIFWTAAFVAAWLPEYGLELVGGAISVILLIPAPIPSQAPRT